jgi:hypothetical protein
MFKERRTVTPKVSMIAGEPLIYVMPLALEKMGYYVKHCAKEIGWLGTAERYDNVFLIKDVYLFNQEVNATTCEINPTSLADFVTEQITIDADKGMEIANSLKLWGHSHVNMGVSPSGQDESQVRTFKDGNDWFIRVIANKSGEMEFALYDFVNNISYSDVKWCMYVPTEEGLEETIKAEMSVKVKDKVYATVNTYANKSYLDSYYDDYEDRDGYYSKKKDIKEIVDKDYKIDLFLKKADGSLDMGFILKLYEPELVEIAEAKTAWEAHEIMERAFETNLNFKEYSEVWIAVKKHIAEGVNTIYTEGNVK